MEQALAGLLLFSILFGLFVFVQGVGPTTTSDDEVVVVKCSKCGATLLKILISKHC